MVATSDGTTAFVGVTGDDSVVRVDLTDEPRVTGAINIPDGPGALALSPDGSRLYVSRFQGAQIDVVDVAAAEVVGTIDVTEGPGALAFTPDGERLYVAGARTEDVTVIDAATDTVIDTVDLGKNSGWIAITPGGDAYLTHAREGEITVLDTDTNTVRAELASGNRTGGIPATAAVSPDGATVYVASFGENNPSAVEVIDTETTRTVGRIPLAGAVNGIAIATDGETAYIADRLGDELTVIGR